MTCADTHDTIEDSSWSQGALDKEVPLDDLQPFLLMTLSLARKRVKETVTTGNFNRCVYEFKATVRPPKL